ncbi:alpha/beta fold hydrolase [Iamia sp.]|uniref:alpha/beta fold hydrolase n=1 Tax=Iamia sp. TaxID=2722710 RepID=UPI002B56ECFD|nr:alpha/beta fold hydrolase [Iamia sp.]HXH57224.1 alpha/beta fold hydrolase [Iamia sp.]
MAVPVDHDDPSGDMIDIAVAVYPVQPAPEGGSGSSTTTTEAGATEESGAASDPLFFLAGGPGQKAVAQVQLLASIAPALLEREVVIMDQRGIGESDPALDCPELDEVTVDPGAEDEVVLAATEECHTALAEGTDLSAYGTPANAADIDLVRQALDYEQINLMGTSYGSRLALEYARDHSDSLRSLVLNSPVPTDVSYFEDVPQNGDDALSALIAACEAEVECARDNPDLNGSVEEALQRSEQAPEVAIEDPASGETVTVRATTAFVSYALFNTMYIGPLLGGLPQAITAAGAGDFAPLFQAAALTINPGGTSTGMFLSNVCAEGISLVDIDEVEDDAADVSSYAATQAVSLAKIVEQCAVWDVEAAPDAAFEPVSTDVPTLIVTGAFDPITPTSYGEAVEEDLSEATLVEVGAAGHDPLSTTPEPECGQMILIEFLTDPSAEVDDGCATEVTPVFRPMAEALEAFIRSQQPQGGG